jgi:SAM-dependent methyltransferase
VRGRLSERALVIEMGAGDSLTVAGLMPPARTGIRYVATDVSPAALRTGRPLLGGDTVSALCDAVEWPFRERVADLVLVLGVLHHLSDWRAALDRACQTVRPGGFLLLHEAVMKPRVFARHDLRGLRARTQRRRTLTEPRAAERGPPRGLLLGGLPLWSPLWERRHKGDHGNSRLMSPASPPPPAPRPAHTVRSATVGGIREARTAGVRPASAPMRMAEAMPPVQAWTGITVCQCLELA